MKLSIIVPVYKVEKTLERCVKSILSQSFTDYELLLIDDGSPDRSGAMAEKIGMTDGRIRVMHKQNGGLSDARNYGLDRCNGSYVTFIDSDDELAPGTLDAVMSKALANPNYDIIEYPVKERPGRPDEHVFNPGNMTYATALDWLSRFGLEHCWAWNKVYKRAMFGDVRFPKGKIYEDVYTLALLLKKNPLIATIGQGMYLYHWNGEGIVAQSTKNSMDKLLEAQMYLVRTLGINTAEKRWHRTYMNMFNTQLYAYRNTHSTMLWNQKVSIKKYNSPNDCVKAVMLNVLKLKLSCRLFNLFSRI